MSLSLNNKSFISANIYNKRKDPTEEQQAKIEQQKQQVREKISRWRKQAQEEHSARLEMMKERMNKTYTELKTELRNEPKAESEFKEEYVAPKLKQAKVKKTASGILPGSAGLLDTNEVLDKAFGLTPSEAAAKIIAKYKYNSITTDLQYIQSCIQKWNDYKSADHFFEVLHNLKYPEPWPHHSEISRLEYADGKLDLFFNDIEPESESGGDDGSYVPRHRVLKPGSKKRASARPSFTEPERAEVPVYEPITQSITSDGFVWIDSLPTNPSAQF